jgi:hypothetical protein
VKNLPSKCTPGYPLSEGPAAFPADHASVVHGARMQWGRLGSNAAVVRVQTVTTDIPGSMSALSSVRRA